MRVGIRPWGLAFGLSIAALVVAPQGSHAETLAQALGSAYRSNPVLLAERSRLEATDEQVPQALSGYRPRLSAGADVSQTGIRTTTRLERDNSTLTSRGYQIEFTQSVFRGYRTFNAIRQAEANVLAARETVRIQEQNILLGVITAYMDVIRDRTILNLRENDIRFLAVELTSVRNRFAAGDATRADVAQARARRARAVAALDLAKANLKASRATYRQLVGHEPGALRQPAAIRGTMPRSLQAALELAQSESPEVVRAAFVELAAQRQVDLVRGELLPEVNLEARYSDRYDTSSGVERSQDASVTGRITVPLYQGGDVYARLRAARRTREGLVRDIDQARRVARTAITSAWAQWRAAKARVASTRLEVEANRVALKAIQAEERAGQRTLLDVLDAKQELLDAQSGLVTARRDTVVTGYTILSAIGRLTAADLKLPTEQHDPDVYYNSVRDKVWGATVTPEPDYSGYSILTASGLVAD